MQSFLTKDIQPELQSMWQKLKVKYGSNEVQEVKEKIHAYLKTNYKEKKVPSAKTLENALYFNSQKNYAAHITLNTIHALCFAIEDEAFAQKILATIEAKTQNITADFIPIQEKTAHNSKYLGIYTCHYRRDSEPYKEEAILEINLDFIKFTLQGKEYLGKHLEVYNSNLFIQVVKEKRIFNLVLYVGDGPPEQLHVISGVLSGTDRDGFPICLLLLLTRKEKSQNIDFDTYFKSYENTLLRGWRVSQMTSLLTSRYRINGLFGNWYIYHQEKNGDIRRGKVLINYTLEYSGTSHDFKKGSIKKVNETNIEINFHEDDKKLYLLGRISNKSNLKEEKYIQAIFSSLGKGGTKLKGGSCLLVREPNNDFAAMFPTTIEKGTAEFETLEKTGILKRLPPNQDIEY